MRGQKGSEYDGGHRVPFFVHWPEGHLMGGRDVTPITAHVDVLPTLLDLCGLPQPAEIKFDGRSLAGLLKNTTENWPDRILVTDSQRVKDPIKYRKSSVMTNRWRLVNGKELFDIKADPGQTRNIADQHPKIVDRLVTFYENWWAEIEPTFDDATQIYLGHPAENPARLTSHDWITTSSTAWNQSMVRKAMNGPGNTGFWNVNVVSPGTYELELRRWPKEIDQSIHSALPAGPGVPGARAFRETPGTAIQPVKARVQIGSLAEERPIPNDAKSVIFQMELPTGPNQLSASFLDAEGIEHGAYYLYVRRK